MIKKIKKIAIKRIKIKFGVQIKKSSIISDEIEKQNK